MLPADRHHQPARCHGGALLGAASLERGADADGIAAIIERYVGGPEQAAMMGQRKLSMGPVVYVRFKAERAVSWDLRRD